jgi:hypothetical protein
LEVLPGVRQLDSVLVIPAILGLDLGSLIKRISGMYTPEVCNGIIVYHDADSDGYGMWTIATCYRCIVPDGYVLDSSDCNDANASIHPFAKEVCNGIDDNCDGLIDEITGLTTTNITATKAQFNWHHLKAVCFI